MTAGLQFTERMRGWFSLGAVSYDGGASVGQARGSSIEYVITIAYPQLSDVLADQTVAANLWGTILAPALSPDRLHVTGQFRLLVPDGEHVETQHMIYQMVATAPDGRQWFIDGHKVVHDDPGFDAWADTTTLLIDISDGQSVIGKGIMRISVADTVHMAASMTAPGEPRRLQRVADAVSFQGHFLSALAKTYAGPLKADWQRQKPDRKPKPELELRTRDGAAISLTEYRPAPPGQPQPAEHVILAPGLCMSSAMFTVNTTEHNLADVLRDEGYGVWLFDYRSSPDLMRHYGRANVSFPLDSIAREDWPTALDALRKRIGPDAPLHAVGHCVGSLSLLMALAYGSVDGLQSAVCMQFLMDIETGGWGRLKARIGLAWWLRALSIHRLVEDGKATVPNRFLDAILRTSQYATGAIIAPEERCSNVVCRWLYAIFGPTHRHCQLNDATHEEMRRLFGFAPVEVMQQISQIILAGRVVDDHGNDVYLRPDNLKRMALPIQFIVGRDNALFRPETSRKTYDRLVKANPDVPYKWVEIPGYGHLDCVIGRHADVDVYPHIVKHLRGSAA
jgi:cholesterol oxidase